MSKSLLVTGFFFLIACGVLPILAWDSKRRLDHGMQLPRIPLYMQTIFLQTFLMGLAIITARMNHLRVSFAIPTSLRAWGLGAVLLVVSLLLFLVDWFRSDPLKRIRLEMLAPRNANEKSIWCALAAFAAFGEETTYRAVLFQLFRLAFFGRTGFFVALALSAVFFALAHLAQGWSSTVAVGIFGAAFQILVLATGSLAVAVAVHFVYDVVAGFVIAAKAPNDEATL